MDYREIIEHRPSTTDLQRDVWLALLTIPRGETRTYQQIAKQIGRPGAMRAVAKTCGQNPFAPDVPCHRVVAKNGLGGYSAGPFVHNYIRATYHHHEEDCSRPQDCAAPHRS
jgi:O-6-methylguanine DNA methyltransferase